VSSSKPRLQVRGLSHDFGQGRGLSALDLEVGAGEIVGLLGPNGSGKSTALALLAGLLPLGAAGGELSLADGQGVAIGSRAYRAALGVVFQQPSLDRKLTARENLVLSLRSHGWPASPARERAQQLLELERLAERADEVVDDFSGGMRRRVDLLRALAHHPRLLLMDEPSTGLDERSFRGLWEALDGLRKREGSSVLVATHKPDEAARCDRLIILSNGKVVSTGSPAELIASLQADLLELELQAEVAVEAIVARLRDELQLDARVNGRRLEVPCESGPQRLVQVVEAMGQGTFASISVRRPTLADVFFELSGARLDEDEAPAAPPKSRRRKGKRAA
jgi:ABC-2 type transport system ATP-binding protein